MSVDELMDIRIANLGSRDATIAQVDFLGFSATGTSKRDPQDEDDPEVALLLAYGRAFETLGKKLQKRANSMTKHQDDIKKYKEQQKAKKTTKKPVNAGRRAKVAAKK